MLIRRPHKRLILEMLKFFSLTPSLQIPRKERSKKLTSTGDPFCAGLDFLILFFHNYLVN